MFGSAFEESLGLVLISAVRNLLNCKHFFVISQSPQRSQSFLIFLCALCGLCERSNAQVMTMPEIFYNARKAIGGKDFRGMNGYSTFYSRKGAKLAKKNNEINFLKNLRVFAPLRETFSIPACPPLEGLSGLGGGELKKQRDCFGPASQ